MSLPSLAQSWYFRPNHSIAATGTAINTNRTILKWIVDTLIGTSNWVDGNGSAATPPNPMTVRYSCDSVTAGTAGDGVNRWSGISNLVWNNEGSAHSWIVLRFADGSQVMLACQGASGTGTSLAIYYSPAAGFTGGTTTNRPTATDQIAVIASAAWSSLSVDTSVKVHMMLSADGTNMRFLLGSGGQASIAWIIGKTTAFDNSTWTTPHVGVALNAALGTNVLTATNLNSTASFKGRAASAADFYLATMSFGGALATAQITSADDQSGAWPFFGQQLVSLTATNRGVKGYLVDVWYGSTTIASGSTYPATPPADQHQFVQVGALILPWCKTTIQLA